MQAILIVNLYTFLECSGPTNHTHEQTQIATKAPLSRKSTLRLDTNEIGKENAL